MNTHTQMYTHTPMHTPAHTHTHTNTHIHAHTHTRHTCTCTHAHMHMHITFTPPLPQTHTHTAPGKYMKAHVYTMWLIHNLETATKTVRERAKDAEIKGRSRLNFTQPTTVTVSATAVVVLKQLYCSVTDSCLQAKCSWFGWGRFVVLQNPRSLLPLFSTPNSSWNRNGIMWGVLVALHWRQHTFWRSPCRTD